MQLFQMCVDKLIFPPSTHLSDIKKEHWEGYESEREYLSYLLIAYELLITKYGIVIVTDHQSTDGIDRLISAVDFLTKHKKYEEYVHSYC